MSTIGLMEGAFFVGRKEILDWINSTLDLNLQKVEDTASGAVACQLLDIMCPGKVPMQKVNWAAKQDFEFVANYKILQACFTQLHIERHIDVDRLISGRYMDNLEFMQWFKRFFEIGMQSGKGDYDAAAQRAKGKGGGQFSGGATKSQVKSVTSGTVKAAAPPKASAAPSSPSRATVSAAGSGAAARKGSAASAGASKPAKENKAPEATGSTSAAPLARVKSAPAATKSPVKNSASASATAELRAQNEELSKTITEMRLEMDGLEKERDFYFDKLRDIEILLQDLEDAGKGTETTASIFKILYATADGFEQSETASPKTAPASAPAIEDTNVPESTPAEPELAPMEAAVVAGGDDETF